MPAIRQPAAPSRSQLPLWIAPAAVALASYWGALRNGFVWDDPLVLQQLRAITSLKDLLIVPPQIPHMYYRPVIFASYLIDLSLGGEHPFWFHASVIGWHALNSVLVFALARLLFSEGQEVFAAGAAVLFAAHPIHVESVSWMAGRSDVIACALLLGSILLHQRSGLAMAWLAAGVLLLASLAKESVLLGIALFPIIDWARGRAGEWRRYLPLGLALISYLLLRLIGVGMVGEPVPPGWASPLHVVAALGFYVFGALAPIRQTVYANEVPDVAVHFFLGLAAMAAIAGGLLWGWLRRQTVVVAGLAWFVLTLAPVLGLVLRRIATAPVAERYLYIPSVGVSLLVAYAVAALAQWTGYRRLAFGALILFTLAGAVESARRNHVWSDEIQFWTAAATASENALPRRELADAYLRRGDVEAAERAYLAALQRHDTPEQRAMTCANLGNLYRRLNRVDESVSMFEKGIAVAAHPSIYHGLGFALMRKAQVAQEAHDQDGVVRAVREARAAFERAIALGTAPNAPAAFRDWEPAKTHLLLGQVLFSLGERDAARRHLEEAMRLEPTGLVGDTARQFLQQTGR